MRNFILLSFLAMFIISCKKNIDSTSPETANQNASKTEKLKQLTVELLSLSRNKSFTEIVFNECKKQKYGDYNVRIEELFNSENVSNAVPLKTKNSVLKIVDDLKKAGLRNPILFYPSVETKEKIGNRVTARTQTDDEYIAVVNDGESGGYTNDEYPGYRFNTDGQLEYTQQVTEEFAWNNDVWIIGDEENCSDENMVSAPDDDGNPNGRFQGQPEYAGLIQVTDIGQIESWVSGKLEFKMTILNSSGAIAVGPRPFGKYKRENFRNQKWKDFGHFVGNWNTSTFGNWMFEHWMEEDGGGSNSTTINSPYVSITIPSKTLDDNLGGATIQFTDDISTVYQIAFANIKRRN